MRSMFVSACLVLAAQAVCLGGNWPQWRGPSMNGVRRRPPGARHLERDRERHLETGAAGLLRIDAHHLERPRSSSTWPRAPSCYLVCVDRNKGTELLEGPPRHRQREGAQAEHVVAVAGHRRHARLGDDGHGRAEGVRLRRQGNLGARHAEGLRPVRPELGLRLVAAAPQGLPLRRGPARDEDRRPVLRAGHRQAAPARRAGGSSGRPTPSRSRPTRTRRRRCCAYGGREEIVISGADYVTGHDPATGAELWRAGGPEPAKDRNYRVVASPIVVERHDLRAVARAAADRLSRGRARRRVTTSHKVWSTDQGPDVPTPATDGKYIFILNDRGIVWCRDAKTGAEIWGNQRVRPGTYSASPVIADGKVYVIARTA